MSEVVTAAEWGSKDKSLFTCPSGAVIELRRLDRATLIMCGRLPQVLVEKVVNAYGEVAQTPATLEGVAAIKQTAILPTMIDAYLIAGVSRPKVVLSNADEAKGEKNVRDIPDEDRKAIFAELSKGSPSVPVETESGEVTLDALAEFPDAGQGTLGPAIGRDSEGVQSQTVEFVRVAGSDSSAGL